MTNRSQKSRQRTAICHFSFVIGHWSFGKFFSAVSAVVRKNRSAGVSPASEPRQLLLGQHDLCRLEAGDTFFLTTSVSAVRLLGCGWAALCSSVSICGFNSLEESDGKAAKNLTQGQGPVRRDLRCFPGEQVTKTAFCQRPRKDEPGVFPHCLTGGRLLDAAGDPDGEPRGRHHDCLILPNTRESAHVGRLVPGCFKREAAAG